MIARESVLRRARAGYEHAYVHNDHERMYHFENIINTITPPCCEVTGVSEMVLADESRRCNCFCYLDDISSFAVLTNWHQWLLEVDVAV